MAKEKAQRTKYLRIMEILRKYSSETNPISTNYIILKLQDFNIKIDRRTLYEDIKVLNELGYEVFCKRLRANFYYVVDRTLENHEVRILMDAVESASFITPKKTDELLDKIADLGDTYRNELLKRNKFYYDANKHSNESVFYNISTIEEALLHKHKVSFYYFDLNENAERVYRYNKEKYVVSPLITEFSDNNYYLAAYHERYKSVCYFRIDRMMDVDESNEKIVDNSIIKDFIIERKKSQTFGMYPGKKKEVTLEFNKDDKTILDAIFDKFGEDTRIITGKGKLETKVKVQISPPFITWCCSFGNRIKVIDPIEIVNEVRNRVEELVKIYRISN